MITDLQSATDDVKIDSSNSAAEIVQRVHKSLRKGFAEFLKMLEEDTETRTGLAQDIAMQVELHIKCSGEILYPALQPQQPETVLHACQVQTDILECINVLRSMSKPDGALDTSMLRLMDLSDHLLVQEKCLLTFAAMDPQRLLVGLGSSMIQRRAELAGTLEDIQGRS
jgi:hypothetical protein